MNPELREVLEGELGTEVRKAKRLGGGSINEAYAVLFGDGTSLFVKTNSNAPKGMFEAEARGLRWLEEAGAIRIPKAIALSDSNPAYLALELLTPGKRSPRFDETLGRGLAALHSFGAPSFGLDHDNYIGRLHQSNRPAEDWASFYWTSRLEPQLRLASDRGLIDDGARASFGALEAVLAERVGAPEPPSRLHGDLWGGNLHADQDGEPVLIDPAVYGGHREIDLAMMRLFGGFGERVFAAYEEARPLAPGARQRVSLYQLYPLLVHVNLFGGAYVGSALRALSDCL